ncbi:MAG: NAD-dependent epimerase/dehydratase family protein [Flavobacteriaceae bacterium]
MILVTGGTGLVGSHLIYQLTLENNVIRATHRADSDIERVKLLFKFYSKDFNELFKKIEWIEADLNNLSQLQDAFKDISFVYHCAAYISFDPSRYETLRRVNIRGTANIVNLCINNKIKKLCHVSSVATLGYNIKEIDENNYWDGNKHKSAYAISKYGAEMEVWRGVQEGVKSVIINPGVIIGPGFSKSAFGTIIKMVTNKKRFHTCGKTGYVDVRDIANIMIRLMNSKIENERYILVNKNLSYKKVIDMVSSNLGMKNKSTFVSKSKLKIALVFDLVSSKFFNKERKLSKALCKTLTRNFNYSSKKIKKNLNFEFTSILETFEKSCQFYSQEKSSWK